MTDHPFQPGTVWAPRKGKGPLRRVTRISQRPGSPRLSWSVWYESTALKKPETWCEYSTFKRWAGEQVKP